MVRHRSWLGSVAVAALLVLGGGATAPGSGPAAAVPGDVGIAAASAGCGTAPTLASGNHTIQSSGQNRTYILRVPANYWIAFACLGELKAKG